MNYLLDADAVIDLLEDQPGARARIATLAQGEIGIAAAKLAADIERSQADALQPERIEPHPDLALDAANAVDARYTPDPL